MSLKDFDKFAAEAVETRKEENEDHATTMASNTAAKELTKFAKKKQDAEILQSIPLQSTP